MREKQWEKIFLWEDNVPYFYDVTDNSLYPVEIPSQAEYDAGRVLVEELNGEETLRRIVPKVKTDLLIGSKGLIERLSSSPEHNHLLVVNRIQVNLYGKKEEVIKVYDTRIRQSRIYRSDYSLLLLDEGPIVDIQHVDNDDSPYVSLTLQRAPLQQEPKFLHHQEAIFWSLDENIFVIEDYIHKAGLWVQVHWWLCAAKQDASTGSITMYSPPAGYQIAYYSSKWDRWQIGKWYINDIEYPELEILKIYQKLVPTWTAWVKAKTRNRTRKIAQ